MRLFLSDGREVLSEAPFYLVAEEQRTPCVASVDQGEVEQKQEPHKANALRESRAAQTRSTLASLRR